MHEIYKETLYGLDKKASVKVWSIETGAVPDGSSAVIVVSHGALDGVMTEQVTLVTEGKQGRTPNEQAINEAKGKVKKQLDKNYRHTISELASLPMLPMLAGDYRKVGHLIDWEKGVDISDKLDGVRLLAKCVPSQRDIGKTIKLESRTGQPYSIPHIEAELLHKMEVGEIWDGEAYLHGHVLQDITSAVKRTDTQAEIDAVNRKIKKHGPDYRKPSKDPAIVNPTLAEELANAQLIQLIRPQLEFIVFDVPSDQPWFERRLELTYLGINEYSEGFVKTICYTRVHSEEEMKALHVIAVSNGYEGVMLRNYMGMYESGKRSNDLQKYKEFLEAEFEVVGYTVDKEGHIVFLCRNDLNWHRFNVIFGSDEEKSAMVAIGDSFVSKFLKVKFQSRYKTTLLPQFPVGIMFREGKMVDGVFVPNE